MKIVLSRKGFDSTVGKVPSPIFPDGRMLSLPIPHDSGNVTYKDITFDGCPIARLVSDLTDDRLLASSRAHLDPDLRAGAIPRQAGWQPLFGQDGAAQAHLERHRLGPGDILLFFGWFRRVHKPHERWRYVPDAPDLHVLFGWLEIGEVVKISEGWTAMPPWAAGHPHFHGESAKNNTLYVSRSVANGRIGAGTFDRYRPALQLSADGNRRSRWELPAWWHPAGRPSALTFHGDSSRWQRTGRGVLLDTVGRGQEFVLDGDDYTEAEPWARELIAGTA